MKVKSESEVAQLCLTLSNLMDCSLPGSAVHGIFQARVLEWGAIAFSTQVQISKDNIAVFFVCLFSRRIVSSSLWFHGLQHTSHLWPSLSTEVCPNSCPLIQWCHPAISFSVTSFPSYPQSFPVTGFFPMSWLFTTGGQSTGASASPIVLQNAHSGLISFKIDWFDLLAIKGTLKSLLQHHNSKL